MDLTVCDGNGADATCRTTVTVTDNCPPTLDVDNTSITVTDTDCSGDEAVSLPTATATDLCNPNPSVSNDAAATFPAGQTTAVTYTADDGCGNTDDNSADPLDVTVLYGADIWVTASKHTVDSGSNPGST